MDDVHRNVIQSNYLALVEQTDLDLMVSTLYEKGVFSDHMIERYKDLRHDVRHRKRQLYMDVMTRGPNAFRHLIDALTEAGYWNLARDLDPDSHLHTNPIGNQRSHPTARNNDFISIRNQKTKTNRGSETQKNEPTPEPSDDIDTDNNPVPDPITDIPHFNVTKSTKFVEDNENEKGIRVYRTRGRQGRVLMVFSYTEFLNNIEDPRPGVEVDNLKLKYLFPELGFKVIFYTNLTKDKLVDTLKSLNKVLEGAECVFIVVSSHGYGRLGSYDNDFRCYDGRLMSIYEFLDYFNNTNLHVLQGVPKVFIFQICRGSTVDWKMPMPREATARADVGVLPPDASSAPGPRARDVARDRVYSDILIAHSTVPGLVSWRDEQKGSWYIQALCRVFAAHAHEAHVEQLFTLVDKHLADHYNIQTSSVDRWGFNCRLYLHPGLYE